jgi:polyferredoxin
LESSGLFQTIENFPKGKPILAKPDQYVSKSPLPIEDGTKETLLAEMRDALKAKGPLQAKVGIRVHQIRRRSGRLEVETSTGEKLRALRVILAIGKSGDARQLGVEGEDLPHVSNRLFDPGEFKDEDVLVVGGGDSAIEAAVALAQSGNRVRLSYRKAALDRPKPENLEAFESEVKRGGIRPEWNSRLSVIRKDEVDLVVGKEAKTISASQVFGLIGRELPLAFLKRSGVRMQGDKDIAYWIFLTAMVSFFTMLYHGKSGFARDVFSVAQGWMSFITGYLAAPFHAGLNFSLTKATWYSSLNFLLGWIGSLVFLISGAAALGVMVARRRRYFNTPWNRIKYGYFILVALVFTLVYFREILGQKAGWVESPTYWYSLFYTTTILIFGLRRIAMRKTRYIKLQVFTLIAIQAFFLFLLPFYLFDSILKPLLDPNGYVLREMFPNGKWSSFGFILFWPLNMGEFGKSTFWTWFPFVQTFGILFFLVQRFGKGAYCGWICSCGGMAETLGDEYRDKAPHGLTAKRMENIGQFVLIFALVVTAVGYFLKGSPPSLAGDNFKAAYKFSIDVIFAGTLGLGVYFFLGGRIWCRYGCPLAALMHVFSRFSVYRILSEKKKCISCNVCTKVCHMGIDVMNYANKGIPMNDVECVRCSACVQSCPTETLAFGSIKKIDTQNQDRSAIPEAGKDHWSAGIR